MFYHQCSSVVNLRQIVFKNMVLALYINVEVELILIYTTFFIKKSVNPASATRFFIFSTLSGNMPMSFNLFR